jgi:hypothetical protein
VSVAIDEAEDCVSRNVVNLYRFFAEFQLSVERFELLERGRDHRASVGGQFIKYRIIAARAGALNLYHFGCSLEAMEEQIPLSRTLQGRVTAQRIKQQCRRQKALRPLSIQDDPRHGSRGARACRVDETEES